MHIGQLNKRPYSEIGLVIDKRRIRIVMAVNKRWEGLFLYAEKQNYGTMIKSQYNVWYAYKINSNVFSALFGPRRRCTDKLR